MLYAVTVEPISAMYFLTEPPGPGDWNVQECVDLDVPTNPYLWPEGSESPELVVGRSAEDAKHFKVFKYSNDVARGGFLTTGKRFGGIYSRKSWDRFVAKVLPGELATRSIPDEDPPSPVIESTVEVGGAG